jgi:hypothetical protein
VRQISKQKLGSLNFYIAISEKARKISCMYVSYVFACDAHLFRASMAIKDVRQRDDRAVGAPHPEKFMSLIWYVGAVLVFLYALFRAIEDYAGDDRMVIVNDRSGHAGVAELQENSCSSSNRIRAMETEDFFRSRHDNFLFFDIWSGSKTLDSAWHGVSQSARR